MTKDLVVIGGGILGLATAAAATERFPRIRVRVVEKERAVAQHQTGRNSGVIHSGIYYRPGSYKARFARAGSRSIVEFCERESIPCEVTGKVIIATDENELPRLEALHARGLENGLEVTRLDADGVREHEPHVQAIAGIFVPATGITDYGAICEALARRLERDGHEVHLGAAVTGFRRTTGGTVVESTAGAYEAAFIVNCAGLHSDRLARMDGVDPGARIVPFRGEYYELTPARRHLVKGLIYPVPDPAFPFLGVHFTRMVDGSVHAGPNAVLAFAREGYGWADANIRDTLETLTYGGFWRLVARHAGEGLREVGRSLSKAAFTRSLQRLIPEVAESDLEPSPAGVRAQALTPDGRLVDDFLIVERPGALHVCNAPSPAATSSLEIARELVDRLAAREAFPRNTAATA